MIEEAKTPYRQIRINEREEGNKIFLHSDTRIIPSQMFGLRQGKKISKVIYSHIFDNEYKQQVKHLRTEPPPSQPKLQQQQQQQKWHEKKKAEEGREIMR